MALDESSQATDSTAVKAEIKVPSKKDLLYTSCYCEENIYKFCERLKELGIGLSNYYAVVISNESKTIPVWNSSSSQSEDGLIIWDYHVILLDINRNNMKQSKFYDFDSKLDFPCEMMKYFEMTFKPNENLKDQFKQEFRLINANQFLNTFYSDRMHMFDKKTNTWQMQPPKYDCIMNGNKQGSNLMSHFVDMTNFQIGNVYKIDQFAKWMRHGKANCKNKKQ